MYTSLQLARKYLKYYLNAHNGSGHGMHSPFVFDFILHVLNNKGGYKADPRIEELRAALKKDQRLLTIEDMGAGSRTGATQQRKVSQLAGSALKPPKYARLLYRLVKHYQPQTILELGTSLGITTAYLATAHEGGRVVSIEGSAAVAGVAAGNFASLGIRNIQLCTGNFDTVLPAVLEKLPLVDLAYIDGNHRYEPTMRYFEQIVKKTGSHSILVFDDIHWSEEMEMAWEEIKSHPSVQYSIDTFFLGFVFFRKEFKVKQHFMIRF